MIEGFQTDKMEYIIYTEESLLFSLSSSPLQENVNPVARSALAIWYQLPYLYLFPDNNLKTNKQP